jgi:hypothetical protein
MFHWRKNQTFSFETILKQYFFLRILLINISTLLTHFLLFRVESNLILNMIATHEIQAGDGFIGLLEMKSEAAVHLQAFAVCNFQELLPGSTFPAFHLKVIFISA